VARRHPSRQFVEEVLQEGHVGRTLFDCRCFGHPKHRDARAILSEGEAPIRRTGYEMRVAELDNEIATGASIARSEAASPSLFATRSSRRLTLAA
jgi:hypothetical protein